MFVLVCVERETAAAKEGSMTAVVGSLNDVEKNVHVSQRSHTSMLPTAAF